MERVLASQVEQELRRQAKQQGSRGWNPSTRAPHAQVHTLRPGFGASASAPGNGAPAASVLDEGLGVHLPSTDLIARGGACRSAATDKQLQLLKRGDRFVVRSRKVASKIIEARQLFTDMLVVKFHRINFITPQLPFDVVKRIVHVLAIFPGYP